MDMFLLNLPIIFAAWAGILIAWSAMVVIGLFHVLYYIKQNGYSTRDSDFSSIYLASLGGLIFTLALFIFPSEISLFIDAMVIAAFWYSMILGHITGSNLSGWTVILFEHPIRKD